MLLRRLTKLWKLVGCLPVFCSGLALAQPAGPNNSSNVFNGGGGDIAEEWTNPNLARTQSDTYATIVTTDRNDQTDFLQAQNFGFNIPAGSSINGIVVEVDRFATAGGGGTVDDEDIRIIDASGNYVGTDKSTGLAWPSSDADSYQSYGGVTDNWGVTDWTSAKINNPNFGVAIQAETSNTITTFNLFVDHIRITIYYTVSGSQRYAVASGNWSTANSWALTPGGTPGAGAPTAADDVFIGSGFTITQNVDGADCNSLTIGTTEAIPAGTLTFNNDNRDIDIGEGGLVITANGDIASSFSPTLTTAGDFSIDKVLTNRNVEVEIDGVDGLIISGTGSLGFLRVQSYTTNTGTLTVTRDINGLADRLINGASAYLIYTGVNVGATDIDCSIVGNTIEFAQTVADGNFNISTAGNSYYNVVISGDASKTYSGDITINGNLTITSTGILNNTGDEDITLYGNWTNDNGTAGFVPGNNGSTVIFAGGTAQTITNAAGEDFFQVEVDKTAGTTVTAVNNITISDELLMTEGIFDIGANTLTGAGDLDGEGGELIIGTISATVPQLTGTYDLDAGTITFNGAGVQTIRSTTSTPAVPSYFNVQFTGSGTKSLSGLVDVNGDLTISGTATLDVTASNFGITLAGDWTNSSAFAAQSGTVTLNGNTTQTVTNTAGVTFHNLTINNSTAASAVTLSGPASINNTITFTDGHLITTAVDLLTLNVSASPSGVSDGSHVDGPVAKVKNTTTAFNFPVGDGTNYQPVSVTPTSTATTTYIAEYFSVEQTLGAALGAGVDHISSQDYWSVQRSSGTADAAVTLSWEYSSAPEINNLPQLLVTQWDGAQWASRGNAGTTGNANAGTVTSTTISSFIQPYFAIGSSTTNNPLSNNRYFVTATGNWTSASVWAYRFGGAAVASVPTATKNVFIVGGNTVTISDNTTVSMLSLTIDGTIAMSNTNNGQEVTMNVGTGGLALSTNANITGSDNEDLISVSGNITLNNTATLSYAALITEIVSDGSTISGTGNLPILEVDGDVTNNGTITITSSLDGNSTFTNSSIGSLIFTGSTFNVDLDATPVGNTVRMAKTTPTSINLSNATNDYYHLTIGGTTSVRFSNDINVAGNLTIESGAILDQNTDDQEIDLQGNWINNNGAGGFLQTGTDNCEVIFSGSAAQTIFISSGNEIFEHLTIDNTSATGVTLVQGQVHVVVELELNDGIVHTDATNFLVVLDEGTANGGGSDSFVDGLMKKIGEDAFTFPVGNGSTWARLRIENVANAGDATEFTCQYIHSAYSNTTSLAANITNVSTIEHWLLQRVADAGNNASCNVRLFWEDESASAIEDLADLRVAHFYNSGSGDMWHNFGGTYTDNGDGSGEIVSTTTFTTFSPITFASQFGFNPLPVELVTFTARVENQNVVLEWKTASELNNDYFEVERFTADVEGVSVLGKVPGNGTTNEVKNYTFIDDEPLTGRAYYRLKQVDLDGAFEYSPVITITFLSSVTKTLTLFPNPGNGRELGVYFTYDGPVRVSIFSSQGAVVDSFTVDTVDEYEPITLPLKSAMTPGVYIVRFEHSTGMVTRKWIVR